MKNKLNSVLKLRRQADLNRLVFAYCSLGLLLVIAEVAIS